MLKYASAERNVRPIGDVLEKYLRGGQKVLEIASGTGQHAAAFAQRFPEVTFQPSEKDARLIHSIVGYVDNLRLPNLRVPLHIDVATACQGWALPGDLGPAAVDILYVCNLTHISPFAVTNSLFKAAGTLLAHPDGLLIIYGPFSREGRIYPQSNVDFDRTLRAEDAQWGLRDTGELDELARSNGLKRSETHEMPANNLILVYKRDE